MTVGMNIMNQMFRDFKVAEDVGKMIELRRFEVEFEMYGTVYWDKGKRHYLVGKNEALLLQQIAVLEMQKKYPLPLQTWRDRALVPSGAEEEIEKQIKIEFAKNLRAEYPEKLWQDLCSIREGKENDAGCCILDQLKEQIEGLFAADQLQLFEGFLRLLYLRGNLTEQRFRMYEGWLKEERQEMVEYSTVRDIFEKTFYGFAYKNQQGQIRYIMNANHKTVLEKKEQLEQERGNIVTPIYQERCGYNYDYRLEHARTDFQKKLKELYSTSYFAILEAIYEIPPVIEKERYRELGKALSTDEQKTIWNTFGYQWGIRA